MVFDSLTMETLRNKYRGKENFEVPEIVLLDRYDGYDGERKQIEQLASELTQHQFNQWLGNFINEQDNQHIGVWFEIMLYGWFKQYFNVRFEPVIEGNNPDFAIETEGGVIVVEARAYGLNPKQRAKRNVSATTFSILQNIRKPYFVKIRVAQYGLTINKKHFVQTINQWLDSPQPEQLNYLDDLGNHFDLTADYKPNQENITVASIESFWVNQERLKRPLIDKAKQHQAILEAGYPYVIALFLESSTLSAEEVVSAWLGVPSVTYNFDTDQISEENFDQSGIHFYKNEIRHKGVSGTLVFRADYDEHQKSRFLRGWYVENPYANVKIDSSIFPVESRFIVVERTDTSYLMNWVR